MVDNYKYYYHRNLPHFQPLGYTYFVTFRLANSIPQHIVERLKSEYNKEIKLISSIENRKEKQQKYSECKWSYFKKFDSLLDRALRGSFWLREEKIARVVKEAIHFGEGERYDLICYCIMPNHVHLVFTPIVERDFPKGSFGHLALTRGDNNKAT